MRGNTYNREDLVTHGEFNRKRPSHRQGLVENTVELPQTGAFPELLRVGFDNNPVCHAVAAVWASLHHAFWIGMILIVPASGLLLRLFMLQHDCGHGSLFGKRRWDDWTGRAIGVLTLTPYDYWRRAHAEHHASAGNLEERGIGDIATLTVAEYRALSPRAKFGYRL